MYKEPIAQLSPLRGKDGLTNSIDVYPEGTTPNDVNREGKDPDHFYAIVIPVPGEPESLPIAAVLKYGSENTYFGWIELTKLDDGALIVRPKS